VPAMSSLSSKQGLKQTLPALLIGNRQRDALFMLQAEAGIIKGPLPETNLAFRDAQSEGSGAASQAQEAAHQDVVASLAQKLLGADQRGQTKPLARVLMRARDLTADGVLVSRDLRQDKHAHDMAECILVCSQEAEQMLKNQRGGEEEEEEGEEVEDEGEEGEGGDGEGKSKRPEEVDPWASQFDENEEILGIAVDTAFSGIDLTELEAAFHKFIGNNFEDR